MQITRQGVASFAIFAALLAGIATVNQDVAARLQSVVASGGVTPLSHRIGDMSGELWRAAMSHNLDGSPVLIFAAVGVVLTVLMLKS